MNELEFEIWIKESRNLAEYTIKRYVGAPLILDKWLKETGYNYPPIYTINAVSVIGEIQGLEEFKAKNSRGGNMYGAALNHYKKFLAYKENELKEDTDEIVYNNNVEIELLKIDIKSLQITDYKEQIPKEIVKGTSYFKRNPKKSAEAIAISNFLCEADKSHKSFISKKTGKNYCEGHHLIPISEQKNYNFSLDVHANIVSVCPNCHRILHHGIKEQKAHLLEFLLNERQERLEKCGIFINLENLLEIYS